MRDYALVTGAYWGFTLSDGALRMLVLLHFYALGYDAYQIALLFLLYEFFGVITNLVGGWTGSRLGLRVTLFAGLSIQVAALSMLALVDADWPVWWSVSYVMATQALSGIAKDLTKMSAKSAVKFLVPDNAQGLLFRWVAMLTGSKNALKGAGFFLGGILLAMLGFQKALFAMSVVLALVLVATAIFLPGDLGRSSSKVKFSQIFSKSQQINFLSGARLFLFGARDIWFVVGLPLFMAATLGWDHVDIGGYMAAWVIGYGLVQALAPKLLREATGAPHGGTARWAAMALCLVTVAIAAGLYAGLPPGPLVLIGLGLFGFVFAVNSSVHSYLILAFTDADRAALDVGFYYMANAAGRLIGTLGSGIAYQFGGLNACLWTSVAFLIATWALSFGLPGRGLPVHGGSALAERSSAD
jgi:hypothetical protein